MGKTGHVFRAPLDSSVRPDHSDHQKLYEFFCPRKDLMPGSSSIAALANISREENGQRSHLEKALSSPEFY